MKKKKSWALKFFFERLYYDVKWFLIAYISCLVIFFLLMLGITSVFESFDRILENFIETTLGISSMWIYFGLPLVVIFIIYRKRRSMMIVGFYLRPQIECKGVVTEIRRSKHTFFVFEYFSQEWVLFTTIEGQHVKAYLPMVNVDTNLRFYVGSEGTMYYRKGINFNNFEHFVRNDPHTPYPEDELSLL